MANAQSSAVAEVIALFNLLSAEERAQVTQALKPQSSTAAKIAASPFQVGDRVQISPEAKSVSKKWRGYEFTVTKVGSGGRLYGDNPENVGPDGKQIDPNKRLWPLASECLMQKTAAQVAEATATAE